MSNVQLAISEHDLAAFCRRHSIAKLSLFGSFLHGDNTPHSDIDLLVEFLPDARVSLLDLGGMSMELRELLGRNVDLRTPADLSKYFRTAVLREARPLYAAA